METGEIPRDWRCANVTPIHRKGSRSSVENYRPVSLTSQISKLMESLIRDAIEAHLEKNFLLRDSQHGFRKGRSCLTNLLSFLDEVSEKIENGECVDAIYLDLAKAFDKVPHQRLLLKLENYGIRGKVHNWISAWLSDRSQRVCLQGKVSGWRTVASGVPQGSVLGPILFLIFIDDLDSDIVNSILKFADDTKLYGSVGSDESRVRLQKDLDLLFKWAKSWQMEFNVEKCKVMHLGKRNMHFDYWMGGKKLSVINLEKDLGVKVSADLKSSEQCRQAYGKASQMLAMLAGSITSRDPAILVRIYKSIVRPHLEYCTPAWSPHYKKDKELLEKVQHRFTRMFGHLRHLEYRDRLDKLGLWTLEERRNRADLVEVFRMAKGLSAVKLERFFVMDRTHRTRGHNYKLMRKFSSNNTRHYFFSERVVSRLNSLPPEVVESQTLDSFKSRLAKLRTRRMGFFMDN
jgi:hypothetical protein